MRPASILRTGLIALFTVGLAAAAAAQAASNAFTRTNPVLAAKLSPFAAAPLESIAVGISAAAAQPEAAEAAKPELAAKYASRAVRRDPLAIDARTILAAQFTEPKRGRALDALAPLSKRSRLLQGALLSEYQQKQDVGGVMSVLDTTLRVHPELSKPIMPVLVATLARADAVPFFQRALADHPDWENDFLKAAAANDALAQNLAELRIALGADPSITLATDREIMQRLVKAGRLAEAAKIYDLVGHAQGGKDSNPDSIAWTSALPPIDWTLADDRGFYARPDRDGSRLEISIRPGNGGVLASRIVAIPANATGLTVSHSVGPDSVRGKLHLKVTCQPGGGAIADQPFTGSPLHISFDSAAGDCNLAQISLEGRSYTGDERIVGTIQAIQFDR